MSQSPNPDAPNADESTDQTPAAELAPLTPQPIVAKAGRYYRNARFLLAGLLIVFGGWCYMDGFVRWPAHNAKITALEEQRKTFAEGSEDFSRISAEIQKTGEKYDELSMQLNRALTFLLPVLGVALASYAVYRSRGEIRLENDTFQKPGKPPIPLAAITEVDAAMWERKGIARATYKLPDGTTGLLVLDDFVYDQKPIDAMYEHIQAHLKMR